MVQALVGGVRGRIAHDFRRRSQVLSFAIWRVNVGARSLDVEPTDSRVVLSGELDL